LTTVVNISVASQQRQPLAPAPLSPQEIAWDTPFPTFPGTRKKTSVSEEQKIVQQMVSMDLNEPRRAKGGSNNGSDPGRRGPPGGDGYGRPSGESQKGMPRAYPPQQAQVGYRGPQSQLPGSEPGAGYGRPPQNGYGATGYDQGYAQPSSTLVSPLKDSFGLPSRSMTMPTDIGMNVLANGAPRYPPQGLVDDLGPSAPYNGPVGRGIPRAMTANGSRLPSQRPYPQEPLQQGHQNRKNNEQDHAHQQRQSISDLYDAYYESSPQVSGAQANEANSSFSAEMPSFDNTSVRSGSRQRRMSDTEGHLQSGNGVQDPMPHRQQVNGYPLMSRTKSQPDFRAQVQPQSAVYEMASDAPPLPHGPLKQGYPSERYDQYGNQIPHPQNGQKAIPMGRGYDGSDRGGPQGYSQPGQRQNGLASWGLPSGPSSRINNGPMPPRTNSLPKPNPQVNPDALPAHPVPIRPGLLPNSVANQSNNRPPPVRNYSNNRPATPAQGQSSLPGPEDSSPGTPPVTLEELERLKVLVKNDPNDQAAQLTLARKYVEASEVLIGAFPDQKSRNKARDRYIFDAHKLLKKLVAVQNTEAMFYLADCYGRGSLGLETDNKEAFSLYQSAAKAGHAAAAYRTAVCCELGNEEGGGTRKDPLKAVQWYKRAATLGDTPAMYKMGMIQLKGLLGQSQNSREAIIWLKRAAERADAENPHALHELGLLYEAVQPPDGSGVVIRDEAYALSLFTQAAELGYKFSQFRLGSANEYGLFNLKIDPRLSIMWYSRAAIQEEHQSELALSGWYLTGSDGVLQQSDTEAYLWARKAAMAGLAKAEYAMGYFTEVGIGTPADLEAAKRWYWRAAGMYL
jgi:TPR repeat protein